MMQGFTQPSVHFPQVKLFESESESDFSLSLPLSHTEVGFELATQNDLNTTPVYCSL